MENLVASNGNASVSPESGFWRGKRVFLTGHTGFKGSWLALWLHHLGAEVLGFALDPPSTPSLFEAARLDELIETVHGDVRSLEAVGTAVARFRPEVVFHLAAQSLVRPSYEDPAGTFATNVMGTVHVLEAIRQVDTVRAAVIVTSDKCYENRESPLWGYRESDRMGGADPYSNSKGCAELVSASYRRSFFGDDPQGPALASARAGNVIGGGDWATDRLVPDTMRAFTADRPVHIRHPQAVRPWQHVLEPLRGYLMLARALWTDGDRFADGWNFGPQQEDARPVGDVVDRLIARWGDGADAVRAPGSHPHEASFLRLDCSKARALLGWTPLVDLPTALDWTAEWYRAFYDGADAREVTLDQIHQLAHLTGSASTNVQVPQAAS